MSLNPDHIAEAIDKWHEDNREGPRPHLGCSIAGDECARKIWLQFRLALAPTHSGRQLRMFRRGHREEETVYLDLEAIGLKVSDIQASVDFGSGVKGSFDGCLTVDGERIMLEIKGLCESRFKGLRKHKCRKSEPEYFTQMQLGMLGLGLENCLFFVTCKENDERHLEIIELDREFAEAIRDRAIRIALSDDPPMRLSEDPNFWICKMCDQREACHNVANQVNCRTCAHSTHKPDDSWHCARWLTEIPSFGAQLAGCPDHVMHPGCAPSWTLLEGVGDYSAVYRLPDGREVINGEGGVLTSELV